MGQLRHPGVCRLVHVASDSSYDMLVLELCDAELFAEVAQGGLSEDVARGYFCQVVSAIGYCHSKGVYHRELQLESVLVRDVARRRIKIAGLGITKDRGRASPYDGPPSSVTYMAPEVVDLGGDPDGAAPSLVDVWALGVMLYVMVVCNYPFGHDGAGGVGVRQLLRNIVSGQFSFPSRLELSAEIKDLIGRMLTVDPARRITVAQIRQHPWAAPGMADAAEVFDDVPLEFELPAEESVTDRCDFIDGFDEWDEDGFDDWDDEDGFR